MSEVKRHAWVKIEDCMGCPNMYKENATGTGKITPSCKLLKCGIPASDIPHNCPLTAQEGDVAGLVEELKKIGTMEWVKYRRDAMEESWNRMVNLIEQLARENGEIEE